LGLDVGAGLLSKPDDVTGHAAHFGGYVAGLIFGVHFVRNVKVTKAEKVLKAVALAVGAGALGCCIFWISRWAPRSLWDGMVPWCWARQANRSIGTATGRAMSISGSRCEMAVNHGEKGCDEISLGYRSQVAWGCKDEAWNFPYFRDREWHCLRCADEACIAGFEAKLSSSLSPVSYIACSLDGASGWTESAKSRQLGWMTPHEYWDQPPIEVDFVHPRSRFFFWFKSSPELAPLFDLLLFLGLPLFSTNQARNVFFCWDPNSSQVMWSLSCPHFDSGDTSQLWWN
ncbi:unnamed protein product, partial [Effrenium voratum]